MEVAAGESAGGPVRAVVDLLDRRPDIEHGAAHYPFIVAVHAGWLVSLALWSAILPPAINPALIALYVALQPVRAWVMNPPRL